MDKGWFINKKFKLLIINKVNIKYCAISENSLFKILILEINDKMLFFFLIFNKTIYFIFGLQDQCFC